MWKSGWKVPLTKPIASDAEKPPHPRQDEAGKESPKSRSHSRQQTSLDLKDIRTPGVRRRGQTGTGVDAGAQAYLAVSLTHSRSHGDEFCSGKGNLSKKIKYQRFIISDMVCTSFQRSYRPHFQMGCWLRSLRAVHLGVTFPVVYKVIWSRADSSLHLDSRQLSIRIFGNTLQNNGLNYFFMSLYICPILFFS